MCISIKNHQNNLLLSYDKLGCRSFELNLFSHCFNRPLIGLLQQTVTWDKIRHAGGQAYYYSRTGTSKTKKIPTWHDKVALFCCPSAGIIISLPSSMADFVPCDRLLQKAYLKDLNLNKHIERLRRALLFPLQLTDMTKCPKCMLFTLRDQIITTMQENENCTVRRKYGVKSARNCSE